MTIGPQLANGNRITAMRKSTAEPNTSFILISIILQILRQNKGTLIILEMTYIILRLFGLK
tara:strand:- start:3671 stop:3853 length:183 start_codon:yes stop_codon:yes gene_type:complete